MSWILALAVLAIATQCDAASAGELRPAFPTGAGSAWIVDPAVPGPDLPPVGRSLFDQLFARGGAHDVPFPFTALMRRIAPLAGVDSLGRPGLKRVLIPLGRSLQRTAAAPQFFRFPRVVIAVDGESASDDGALLKDRFYIGYQEKSAVLEVISYNESAGRFEFQLVKNYRAGGTPQVFYANRAVCTACHQNHAPIFSRQQWDETNANPVLAERMAAQGGRYFGIPVARGVDEPYAIDNAASRANLFSAGQRLWRDGCGRDEQGDRCRAAAMTLALQYRLTSRSQFDRDGATYRDAYRPTLAANWRKLWPAGIAIPDQTLPNRSPAIGDGDVLPAMHVPAAFEPLAFRPPQETWRASNDADIDRLVTGLGEFISLRDVQRIDRTLLRHGARRPTRQIRAACQTMQRKTLGAGRARISFRCDAQGQALALRGRVYVRGRRVTGGVLEGLSVERGGPLAALDVAGGHAAQDGIVFSLAGQGVAARTQRGDYIQRVELSWAQPAQVSLVVRDDFTLVAEAAMRLARSDSRGTQSVFGAQPFQRLALISALDTALGGRSAQCCKDQPVMPGARIERIPREQGAQPNAAAGSSTDLTRFYRACASCHDTAEAFPPNFLAGDAQRADASFRHCAQRIFVRLQMWRTAPARRTKTPMPPLLGLALLDATPESWLGDGELDALIRQVEAVLMQETGRAPNLGQYERIGYENLRGCLAGTPATAATPALLPALSSIAPAGRIGGSNAFR